MQGRGAPAALIQLSRRAHFPPCLAPGPGIVQKGQLCHQLLQTIPFFFLFLFFCLGTHQKKHELSSCVITIRLSTLPRFSLPFPMISNQLRNEDVSPFRPLHPRFQCSVMRPSTQISIKDQTTPHWQVSFHMATRSLLHVKQTNKQTCSLSAGCLCFLLPKILLSKNKEI